MAEFNLPQSKSFLNIVLSTFFAGPLLWYFYIPTQLVTTLKNVTLTANRRFALSSMAKHIATPLFGDWSLIGRFMGFLYRIIRILIGSISILILDIIIVAVLVFWLILPPLAFYITIIYGQPLPLLIFLALAVILPLLRSRQPKKKIGEVINQPIVPLQDVLSPQVLSMVKLDTDDFLNRAQKTRRVENLLQRLEVPIPLKFQPQTLQMFRDKKVWETTLRIANETKSPYIEVDHLFVGLISTETMKQVISEMGIRFEELPETLTWIYEMEHWKNPPKLWSRDYTPPTTLKANQTLRAPITPVLNQFGVDLTEGIDPENEREIFGKEKIVEKMITALGRTDKNSIILVGEPGSGKTTTVHALARGITTGKAPKILSDQRVVELDITKFFAGAETQGELQNRLTGIIDDCTRAENIILFIDGAHRFTSPFEKERTLLAAFEAAISSNKLKVIAADSWAEYEKTFSGEPAVSRLFELVEVPEASFENTLTILKYTAFLLEKKYHLIFTYHSLLNSIEFSARYVHDRVLPDKAVDLINEAAAASIKEDREIVSSEDVAQMVSEKFKIPLTRITSEESQDLLNIEEELHKRIVNQNEAITAIGSALQRSRTGLREKQRPIISLLFVGPTGVGKTEIAKALAELYFGSEEEMIRIDLSEFQTPESTDRLLSADWLTTLNRQPHTLVLLDEFEKANDSVQNVFLQILDEGKMRDTAGRPIDFTNTIIIATSNTGAELIYENLSKGFTMSAIKPQLQSEVERSFKPELLNRFDDIIYCDTLSLESVKEITRREFKKVAALLEERQIKLEINEEAITLLAQLGFNPAEGARPLRRLIQKIVEAPLAKEILAQKIKAGDTFEITAEWLKTATSPNPADVQKPTAPHAKRFRGV